MATQLIPTLLYLTLPCHKLTRHWQKGLARSFGKHGSFHSNSMHSCASMKPYINWLNTYNLEKNKAHCRKRNWDTTNLFLFVENNWSTQALVPWISHSSGEKIELSQQYKQCQNTPLYTIPIMYKRNWAFGNTVIKPPKIFMHSRRTS